MNAPIRILERPEKLRLRVEDFVLLEENGAFADYSKAELIDGDIYVMSAQYIGHARPKVRLLVALVNRLEAIGGDFEVVSEVSVRVAGDSMPEPDILVARRLEYGPVPVESVMLVVEVSDTTLNTDLGRKADLYAAAGIPEYWVVDLNERRVVVHDQPGPAGYQRRRDVPFGETLTSSIIPGLEVFTDRLVD